jgi:hypothetical protein
MGGERYDVASGSFLYRGWLWVQYGMIRVKLATYNL